MVDGSFIVDPIIAEQIFRQFGNRGPRAAGVLAGSHSGQPRIEQALCNPLIGGFGTLAMCNPVLRELNPTCLTAPIDATPYTSLLFHFVPPFLAFVHLALPPFRARSMRSCFVTF
jgi:hypothetical protein